MKKSDLTLLSNASLDFHSPPHHLPEVREDVEAYLKYDRVRIMRWLELAKNKAASDDQQQAGEQALRAFAEHGREVLKASVKLMSPSNMRDWMHELLLEFMAENDTKYERGMGFTVSGGKVTVKEFISQVTAIGGRSAYYNALEHFGEVAVEEFISRQNIEARNKALTFLERVDMERGDRAIRGLLCYLQAKPVDEVSELDVAAIKSMLWQVKRKAKGFYKELFYPLFVVFNGGQGAGKTWATSRLFAPLRAVTSGSKRLEQFNNQFNTLDFNDYLVIPFSDMEYPQHRAYDMGLLKELVTDAEFQYREPHTKNSVKMANTATMYGTSNYSVKILVPDPTGARRMWEITSPQIVRTPERDLQGSQIDYEGCWLAVDGNDPTNPRTPFLDEMEAVQIAAFKHHSHIELCVAELFQIQDPELQDVVCDGVPVTFAEAFIEARLWFEEQGMTLKRTQLADHFRKIGVIANSDATRPAIRGVYRR